MPATNLFGVDVGGLDVPDFLSTARTLFVVVAVAWVLALARVRRAGWLTLGILLANAYAWGITNWPLARLYGLGSSSDRLSNLGLVQVVAAGNPPLHTIQVGQLHFEPFWGLIVACLSGFDTERVLAIYPFMPLLMATGFVLSLYFGLAGDGASAWERALIAGSATLVSSLPLDFLGTYRVPWVMTFLLKPNHALGLVLFPLVLRAFSEIRGWRGRLGVGVLLHLLGWAFVVHMAYVCVGLVVFALHARLTGRPDSGRDLLDVAVVIGINLLVVSPYLAMLVTGYPLFTPSEYLVIWRFSPHLLEGSLRMGLLFWLGLWGLGVSLRHRGRLGRLWGSQVVSALVLWVGYLGLSAIQQARERDEIFYWLRFLLAASAAVGAWDLLGRLWAAMRWARPPVWNAALLSVLLLPWSLPYWWDPLRMDPYFRGSLAPLPERLVALKQFLRQETSPGDVFAGDGELGRFVSALAGRRVLLAPALHAPKDYDERARVESVLVRETDVDRVRAAAEIHRVRYLMITPAFLARYPGAHLDQFDQRAHLHRVFLWGGRQQDYIAIYRVAAARS